MFKGNGTGYMTRASQKIANISKWNFLKKIQSSSIGSNAIYVDRLLVAHFRGPRCVQSRAWNKYCLSSFASRRATLRRRALWIKQRLLLKDVRVSGRLKVFLATICVGLRVYGRISNSVKQYKWQQMTEWASAALCYVNLRAFKLRQLLENEYFGSIWFHVLIAV